MGMDSSLETFASEVRAESPAEIDQPTVEPFTFSQSLFDRNAAEALSNYVFGDPNAADIEFNDVTVLDDGTVVYHCLGVKQTDRGVEEVEFSAYVPSADRLTYATTLAETQKSTDSRLLPLARPLDTHNRLRDLSDRVRQNPIHAAKLDRAIAQLREGHLTSDVRNADVADAGLFKTIFVGQNAPRLVFRIVDGQVEIWGEFSYNDRDEGMNLLNGLDWSK
jgi:hypothetical protein